MDSMHPDESSLADGARKHAQKIPKKRSFRTPIFVFPSKDKGKGRGTASILVPPSMPDTESESILVEFRDKRKNTSDEGGVDQFRWATLYENQRGITMFSTAYYSRGPLFPNDPPAFTVPDGGDRMPLHPHQAPPNVTLNTYPLPDPTWRWVSKAWLVDMRGDGDVQHDGFEYNWFFRRNNWRAHVGWFSAGGYVRRRRWVRLMMRPSDAHLQAEAAVEERGREDALPDPSTETHPEDLRVWRGDDRDWDRLCRTLKNIARDGLKLELWADWLSDFIADNMTTPPHSKTWTKHVSEYVKPELEPEAATDATSRSRERPPREWIFTILREHGKDLRNLFIHPDSRAQLRDLFVRAGLVPDITLSVRTPGPYIPPNASAALEDTRDTSFPFLGTGDFWSYSSGLDLYVPLESDDQRK